MEVVRALSKPGGALAPSAATSTMNNPAWWRGSDPRNDRRRLHRRLRRDIRDLSPHVEQGHRAIVLAGPPGAGKSTVLNEILGDQRDAFLVIDADEFKRALLNEALTDGSYEAWIKPTEIRDLEDAGEKFFPLELASLVHEESSFLAYQLRAEAIAAGDNVVIDTVLSGERGAIELGVTLAAAGYEVEVIDVEVPYELSEARIRTRWEQSYAAALDGGDTLGGRWVPSEYAREVFDGPDGRSRPEVAARALADTCPAVTRYRVFRTELDQADRPQATAALTVDLSRRSVSQALVDTTTLDAARRASVEGPAAAQRRPRDKGHGR